MRKTLIRLTEGDLHRIVKESVNRILDEGWSSYADYYYSDNEKEPKENNYFNPEKAKKEPSKSSRVRRREYMRKRQENVEESTIMRLTESDLHKIVKESIQRVLREVNDPIGQFADICCKDEEILRCKTAEEVFNTINSHLQKTYKGRATERKIASVAKDVTVSVCLKLHIPGI